MRFWRRQGTVYAQALRVRRYDPFLLDAVRRVTSRLRLRFSTSGFGPTRCALAIQVGREKYVDPLLESIGTFAKFRSISLRLSRTSISPRISFEVRA
jgi:hypothetical protein